MRASRFPDSFLAAVDKAKILGIRAGRGSHRIIGIWVVVVEGRVFVRSWDSSPDGWYHALLEDPQGLIQVGARTLRIRAVRTRSERIRKAVDAGYAAKYDTPGSVAYVRGFRVKRRRDTTTELVPLVRAGQTRRKAS